MMAAEQKCGIDGCDDTVHAKEMCGRHYAAAARGTIPAPRGVVMRSQRIGSTLWQAKAACRDEDPELFFPVSERYTDPSVAAARRVCATCPVRQECLEWSLTALTSGIAGGLTTEERRAVRRNRAAAGLAEAAEIGVGAEQATAVGGAR